jgi:D-arabinose 1-dehydrogenase-like Zn-dependent alcohol dehydrogenase
MKMRAAQIPKAGADFEIVERQVPSPGPGQIRIRVQACGVCRSDVFAKEGWWPGITYPRIPGHEIAGVVDAVGAGVTGWDTGQRAAVGFHGGRDGTCNACRRGDFINCPNQLTTGISFDGGYAEYMVAPVEAVVRVPESLSPTDIGPLVCAGTATFNALRHCGASPGDLVAVQGLGGLGHLGIQFAAKFGYTVAAIGHGGGDSATLAKQLGAHVYIDSASQAPAEALQQLGGATAIIATAPDAKAMSDLLGGLGVNSHFMIVGGPAEPISVPPLLLINGKRSIHGWPAGVTSDSEDTLRFAALAGVRPMTETYPLTQANEAYASMLTGKARFRAVLTMDA